MTQEALEARLAALESREALRAAEVPPIVPWALYTVAEAAERLRCSLSTIYGLARGKELASVKIGAGAGGIRVQGSDLLAFIDVRREGGPAPKMAFKHMKPGR